MASSVCGGELCYLNNPEFLNSFHFLWILETLLEYLHLKLLNSFNDQPLVLGRKLEFILPNTSTDIYILKESYLGSHMLKKESLLEKKRNTFEKKLIKGIFENLYHSASTSLLEEAPIQASEINSCSLWQWYKSLSDYTSSCWEIVIIEGS